MDDLRNLLHEAAEDLRLDPSIPPKTLRRAKRRRMLTVVMSGTIAAGLAAGGFLGLRLVSSNEVRPGSGDGNPVTGVAAPPQPPAELQDFVTTFMQARIAHEGVEDLMAVPAMDAYNSMDSGLSLFRAVEDGPGYGISSWEQQGQDGYTVRLLIETVPGPRAEDLKLGPGTTVNGEQRGLIVLRAERAPLPIAGPAASRPAIQILNGTNQTGVAARVAQALEKHGYVIKAVGNASRTYPVTTLFYRADSLEPAQRLANEFFPGALLETATNNLNPEIQVTVVIGENDIARRYPSGQAPSTEEPIEIIKVQLLNGTDRPDLLNVYARRLRAEDYAVQTGNASRTYERTTVFAGVRGEESAGEIADSYFRGAHVEPASGPMPEGVRVVIVLGKDLPRIASYLELVDKLARRFVEARLSGTGAETFLSAEAKGDFAAGHQGLTLYAPQGVAWLEIANRLQAAALENDTATVPVTIVADRDTDRSCSELYFEQLIVSTRRTPVTSINDLIISGATGPGDTSGTIGDCGSQ